MGTLRALNNLNKGFVCRMQPVALQLQKMHLFIFSRFGCIASVSEGIFGINTSSFVSSSVKHWVSSEHRALKQSSYSLCNPSDRLSGLWDVLMVTWAITQNNSHCILSCTCCMNCFKIPDLTDGKHRLQWLFILGAQTTFTQQHVLFWSQAT